MGAARPDPAEVVADAGWLPFRLSEDLMSLSFARLPRERHREVKFLEEKFLPADVARHSYTVAEVEAAAAAIPAAPPRFLFHSSMAGSTLLARMLDRPGTAMALSEPIILNQLSAAHSKGADVGDLTELIVRLLSRPFGPGELVAVKPANTANNLMDLIAARFPGMRALTMEAPVAELLATVAKRGGHGRMIYRRLYAFVSRTVELPVTMDPEDLWELTDLEVAAYAWMLQHAEFLAMLTGRPEQFRSLASARLFERDPAMLAALRDFFGLGPGFPPPPDDPVYSRHSKDPAKPYDRGARQAELDRLAATYGEEVERGVGLARELAREAGIPLDLPNPL